MKFYLKKNSYCRRMTKAVTRKSLVSEGPGLETGKRKSNHPSLVGRKEAKRDQALLHLLHPHLLLLLHHQALHREPGQRGAEDSYLLGNVCILIIVAFLHFTNILKENLLLCKILILYVILIQIIWNSQLQFIIPFTVMFSFSI